MSNFWDSMIFPAKVEAVVESKSDFWSSIGVSVSPQPKPVKQNKPKKATAKKNSEAVVKAERVYETVDNMIVPAEDCKHYWIIPANTKWVIGTCKLCKGERWFNTQYEADFNGSIASPKIEFEDSLKNDYGLDVESFKEAFKAEQAAAAAAAEIE